MPLNSKIQVPLPKKGIIVRTNGSCPYVYKVTSTFRNEKGQPTNTRQLIGKLDPETGMLIPNDNYYTHFENTDVETPPSSDFPSVDSVHSIGATFLIRCLLTDLGVTNILTEAFGATKANAIITASTYMACRGNVFEHVADWCETSTLHETPLTSKKASSLFSSITHADRMLFFKWWIESQKSQSKYLVYDVASHSSYTTGIAETDWGYNRCGDKLPQINLGCYTCKESGMPVFYVTYPGSIVDKSHLPYMMAYNVELGIEDVDFVMNMEFCSTPNLNFMHSSNYHYIIPTDPRQKTSKTAIDEVRNDIVSMRNHIGDSTYGRSVHSRFYGLRSTLHIYYNPNTAEDQNQDLYRTVESQNEKLGQVQHLTEREGKKYASFFDIERNKDGTFTYSRNCEKIDKAARNHGFFCILTNTKLSSSEILALYQRKEIIEKGFDDLKNHIEQKQMHTHFSDIMEGKMFCAFIALIVTFAINNGIHMSKMKEIHSKDTIFSEMEKIKVVVIADGKRLMSPVTKTQRAILKAFGIDEERLKKYALHINLP